MDVGKAISAPLKRNTSLSQLRWCSKERHSQFRSVYTRVVITQITKSSTHKRLYDKPRIKLKRLPASRTNGSSASRQSRRQSAPAIGPLLGHDVLRTITRRRIRTAITVCREVAPPEQRSEPASVERIEHCPRLGGYSRRPKDFKDRC